MNDLFSAFINWQSGLLCLGVFVFTYAIRRIVETIWLGAAANRFWQGIFLPLGPIGTGMILGAFSQKFPWPMPLISSSLLARVMYGAICGMASGWVYVHFRKYIKDLPGGAGASTPPAAGASPDVKDPEPPPEPQVNTPSPKA